MNEVPTIAAVPEEAPDLHGVIDGTGLRESLTAIATDKSLSESEQRLAVLECLRSAQTKGRDIARERLEAGLGGREVAQLISAIQDVVVQSLFDYTTIHVYRSSNPTDSERLGVLAVGGYGRGDLAPGSDLDLLFVLPYKQTAWGESVVEYMLYILWDMGLKVGHATRTVPQCISLAKADMTIRTSLLEMRHLTGDEDLFQELHDEFWSKVVPGTEREFINAKFEERELRHKRAGQSRYLVEPNIKESKGGFRDLQSLYWMAKYVYGVENPRVLIEKGLFTETEYKKILDAYSFLWAVRCHLHFLTGRAEEKLSFDVQPEMAKRMGFADGEGQSAVELFMKAYFRVAKNVGDLTRIFSAGLELKQSKATPGLGNLFRLPRWGRFSDDDFQVENGRLKVTDSKVFIKDHLNILRYFHRADEREVRTHPEALKLLSRSLHLIDDDLREDPEANRLFLDILTSPRDPERILRRMSEAGVLGRFIPAFGRVEAMMQFNMYHHYTVDEHTLYAIGLLSQIERGELGYDHPLANEIVHKVLSRRVLYVALFLHDIEKGRPEDHSVAGARLARELCPRLGLDGAETETVAWLVEHHLAMSEFAQSRDISDPKTIEDFTRLVQGPERLRLLLVLTVADIRAVGPGVWNGWKGQLLRDLYYEAESVLQGGGSPGSATRREARIAAAREALQGRLKDWPADEREHALSCQNDAYWLTYEDKDHERFATIMREARKGDCECVISFSADEFMSITELVVYAPDQTGLFARLSGAIAVSGASIKDAKAFTMSDGMALDIFYVQDATGGPYSDKTRLKKLETAIQDTVAGRLDPAKRLARPQLRRREQAFTLDPEILVDNQASDLHTLIEISGRDRPGLLFDLSQTLVDLRLSIVSAHISTYGERAVDVFYVKDRAGLKITSQSAIETLQERLKDAMSIDGTGKSAVAAE